MSTHYFSFNFLRNRSVFAPCYWCVCSRSAIFHPVMWNDTQSRPPLVKPITLATTASRLWNDSWCSQRYKIATKEKEYVQAFPCAVQNSLFSQHFAEYLLPPVFGVFSFFHLVSKDREFNLFLVHVLRYVAASVPRVLNSYLMTRQRWRDRGEEGVSVTPSPRYSSGCQIIFSQTFNFPILATTRAIHWKLPGHGHYRPGPRKWSRTETDAINILVPYPGKTIVIKRQNAYKY